MNFDDALVARNPKSGASLEEAMDKLGKILTDARKSRAEALELLTAINAGTAELAHGVSRERALEILNGCLSDYDAIIKRFGRY